MLRTFNRKAAWWRKHRAWWTLFKGGSFDERITEDGLDVRITEDAETRITEGL